MKILFNTDQIHLHGGIEKVMATKANYFAAIPGVEVFIVTTEQGGKKPCYPIDPRINLVDLGVDYNRAKSYFSRENLKKSLGHFFRQWKLFRKLRPDAIISPNFNFDHYWLPSIKNGAKLIKERHSSRFYEADLRKNSGFFGRMKFWLDDFTDGKYSHIAVLNEDEKNYLKSQNAMVIPNPVAMCDFSADVSQKKILAAGRISSVKGFSYLIDAFSRLANDFPDWQLHIYGQDYLGTQENLQQKIDDLGLQNSIIFKKSVENLPEKMQEYSIYAMTSETECFPMVLLEALSAGLPMISWDCPNGPRNIITDGEDGFLTPYKNLDIFTEKLAQLMGNLQLRKKLSENAKKNAHRFSEKVVMSRWLQLLNLPHV